MSKVPYCESALYEAGGVEDVRHDSLMVKTIHENRCLDEHR